MSAVWSCSPVAERFDGVDQWFGHRAGSLELSFPLQRIPAVTGRSLVEPQIAGNRGARRPKPGRQPEVRHA